MQIKPFELGEYLAHDRKAKSAVRDYLDSLGHYTTISEDYHADIKSYRPVLHEVEIKVGWTDGDFQFDTVHIPERKKKLLKRGEKIMFWILRADMGMAMLIDGAELQPWMLEEVSNNKMESGERFFAVPKDKATVVDL